jgi:Helix-turn-helix domain
MFTGASGDRRRWQKSNVVPRNPRSPNFGPRGFFSFTEGVDMLCVPTVLPQDELLSMPQCAQELGVTTPTARFWALRGKLPARPADHGRLLVRRADLNAFRAKREASAK